MSYFFTCFGTTRGLQEETHDTADCGQLSFRENQDIFKNGNKFTSVVKSVTSCNERRKTHFLLSDAT